MYRGKGSSMNEIHRVVEVFNKALEEKDRDKRFFFDDSDNPYYRGQIWYGTPEGIKTAVETLELKVELYTSKNSEKPAIKNP